MIGFTSFQLLTIELLALFNVSVSFSYVLKVMHQINLPAKGAKQIDMITFIKIFKNTKVSPIGLKLDK